MKAFAGIQMATTENHFIGFILCHVQIVPAKPVFQRLVEAFSISFQLKGTDKIIGIATEVNLSPTMRLYRFAKPDIQHMVQVDIR